MTDTGGAAPEGARDELETAISEALTRAWCMAVTYAAVSLASDGVPLSYPEAAPETAKLLAAVDAYGADEVTAALEIARRVPLTTVFGHRYTVIPDAGEVDLGCGSHSPEAVTWRVGYHPSLDVLIGQASAHDRAEHPESAAGRDRTPADAATPEKDPFGGHEFHYESHTDLFRCIKCHAYEVTAREQDGAIKPCAGQPPAGSQPIEVNAW